MRCSSLEEMLDLVREARASGEDALARHAATCARCREARGWVERLLDATAGGPLPEPPAHVMERAFEIVPRRREVAGLTRRGWSLGRLMRDSFTDPLPVGVRGLDTGSRRLLYNAGDADLDVEVRETTEGERAFRVTGQLLVAGAPPPEDLLAALTSREIDVPSVAGDETGMFVFRAVPPGVYRLEVWAPGEGRAIRVEPFAVGTAGA